MTYRDLIRTFEIIAKYDGGLDHKCLNMWAEHDEHGIAFDSDWDVSVDDIRELAAMGWLLGCDFPLQVAAPKGVAPFGRGALKRSDRMYL